MSRFVPFLAALMVVAAPALGAALVPEVGLVARVETPQELARPFTTPVDLGGRQLVLDLHPVSVRAPGFQVLEQRPDGTLEPIAIDPPTTVRGTVRGIPGAIVAGSVSDLGLEALVQLPGEPRIWIEPLALSVPGAMQPDHLVYAKDVRHAHGTCAQHADGPPTRVRTRSSIVGGCGGDACVAEIACDTDAEFAMLYGAGTASRIENIINTVNVQYERDCGIVHEITTIIVRSVGTPDDPYDATDAQAVLDEFEQEWNANQESIDRDLAQLFCGKDFDGSVVGYARTTSVCTPNAYSVVQDRGAFSTATDLSAHELGHNWGAVHCSCAGDASTGYTMNSSLTSANRFHPFSTIPDILDHRDSRACLGAVEAGTAPLPFVDDFESLTAPALDGALWTGVEGAASSTLGSAEPSGSNALVLGTTDEARSARLDASDQTDVELAYAYQAGGTTDAPPAGAALVVEYFDETKCWVEIARHVSGGAADAGFFGNVIPLGAASEHAELRVRFRSENTGSGVWFVDDVSLTSITAPPTSSALAFPFNGQTFIPLEPEFQWTMSQNTVDYRLIVDDHPSFADPAIDIVTTDNFYTPPPGTLTTATVYWWRVVSRNSVAETNSTPVASTFTTLGSAPEPFTLIGPGGNQSVATLTPTLSWNSSPGASEYRVLVDTFFDFNTAFVDEIIPAPSGGAATASFDIPEGLLVDGGGYFWKVQALNLLGSRTGSPSSESFFVQLAPPPCDADVDGNGSVNVNDISFVIFRLGDSGTPGSVEGDADASGVVDTADLSFVIFRLGPCP